MLFTFLSKFEFVNVLSFNLFTALQQLIAKQFKEIMSEYWIDSL